MRESFASFLGALHRDKLKMLGYKKVRGSFSRAMNGYTERIQFQCSAWNDMDGAQRFYINFGVEFIDLPARIPCHDFPQTHCWTRIGRIVPSAPSEYKLHQGSSEDFAAQIACYLDCASQQVSQQIQQIRRNFEHQGSPLLTTAV